MAIVVPPNGTYGASFPRPPKPLIGLVSSFSTLLYRLAGRRMRPQGLPTLLLTTVGTRSQRHRSVILGYLADDPSRPDGWIVVASLAGAARQPAWLRNMAGHPNEIWVTLAGVARRRVHAELLSGESYEVTWARLAAIAPGYADYQRKTDRTIPLIRLTPAEP